MNQSNLPTDPLGIARSLFLVHQSWMYNNAGLPAMTSKLSSSVQAVAAEQLSAVSEEKKAPKAQTNDPEAALMEAVKTCSKLANRLHNIYANWLRAYVGMAPGIPDKEKQRSIFWTNQLISALSPANFFWTNPSVVQKFLNTKGESLRKGYENWVEDIHRGDNLIQIADTSAFKVGQNIAVTPGAVVFRNRLMELIEYCPRTETTFEIPVVFIQPWINKYYILDMTEEKSLIAHLLNQGFTVFVVSWKNPSADMRNVTFEDYMLRGALKAVEAAREICGAHQVHAVGYCIGGTVLSALLAYLNKGPKDRPVPIRDLTLFATLVDFSSPGELEVLVTEEFVEMIEELIRKEGYLDKKYMAAAFRALRSNNLIWRYYVHNYLRGEAPPKSDFLFWNSDSTRLPAAMCSYYLREFYLNNNLVKEDKLQLGNRPISLRRIRQPLYLVGTEQDHICPWKQAFKIFDLVSGSKRFALSDEGHITGIVNPPSARSRRKYWISDINGTSDPDKWLSEQQEHQGSWWPDWVAWLSEKSGERTPPPAMGNDKYIVLQKAPGSYVLEQ
ncbi:MAG: alpha/beta fold hydrolase [Syntrophobacteraceae bacterium]|nr:alpha/beta fold hydrolase [Syntrophobacteraceae bacterium]